MKYLLLIYGNPKTWEHPMFLQYEGVSQEDRERFVAQFADFHKEIDESGEWAGGEPLAAPTTTRTVRVRGGEVTTTDGPYLETKEHLAGFIMVDCESIDRAVELAARIPDAQLAAIEVRPVMEYSGTEM